MNWRVLPWSAQVPGPSRPSACPWQPGQVHGRPVVLGEVHGCVLAIGADPVLVITAGISVALHPSGIGAFALLLLTVVGVRTEVLIWRRLRLRWTDLPPEAVGRLFEPNRLRDLAFATVL